MPLFELDERALKRMLADELGITDARWEEIRNGDECRVFRVHDGSSPRVVRVHPLWHDAPSIRWTHALSRHCSLTVPEAVAPLELACGDTLAMLGEHVVSVYPAVPGGDLDRGRAELRADAARVLAALHAASARWPGAAPRPQPPRTSIVAAKGDGTEVVGDRQLDAWERSLPELGLTRLAIHGDYYPRNVLATADRVTGVIDWDEADVGYLMAELAWAVWEFCPAAEGDTLRWDWAEHFLRAYLAAGPPCARVELAHLLPFIRLRLRREILYQLDVIRRGGPWGDEHQAYLDSEIRAFDGLRGQHDPLDLG